MGKAQVEAQQRYRTGISINRTELACHSKERLGWWNK